MRMCRLSSAALLQLNYTNLNDLKPDVLIATVLFAKIKAHSDHRKPQHSEFLSLG